MANRVVVMIIFIGVRDRWRPVLYIDTAAFTSPVSMATQMCCRKGLFSSKVSKFMIVCVKSFYFLQVLIAGLEFLTSSLFVIWFYKLEAVVVLQMFYFYCGPLEKLPSDLSLFLFVQAIIFILLNCLPHFEHDSFIVSALALNTRFPYKFCVIITYNI